MATVLVVGGRTTGLMAATELARRGIAVRIIDKSPGIDPHVRANLIHSRSLEIFMGLGLSEQMTEGSFAELGMRVYSNGRLTGEMRHTPIDSPFPFGMSQSQAHVEAVLEARLAQFGVAVERSVELLALEQDEHCVHARLRDATGHEELVQSPWLVGCDGAHSAVRQLTGCSFPGESDPYPYMLADVLVEGDLTEQEGHIFLADEGELFVFSTLPEGRRLLCANLPAGTEVNGAPTLEQIQAVVAQRGLSGLRISDPRWLSYFHIGYHLAPHYRLGRIFLAGDAAHIHSLLAGQGMNTGIQDAYNLAWKLALVIQQQAPLEWLDSYEIERKAVGSAVVRMTREATEKTELYAGLSAGERERLLAHMFVPEQERLQAARHLQEVDLDYLESPLSLDKEGTFAAGPRAGSQAPDASPLLLGGDKTSLYKIPVGIKFRQLLFSGRDTDTPAPELIQAATDALTTYGALIDVFIVVASDRVPLDGLPAEVTLIVDPESAMHRRYGADTACLYLIRPDGYVAYRSPDINSLGSYVSHTQWTQ